MLMRFRPHVIAGLVCVIGVASMLAGPSAFPASSRDATVPGKNGRIAFRRYFDAAHETGSVFTIAPNGTREVQVTPRRSGVVDDQPDWSPDGRRIAFHRTGSPYAIFIVRPGSRPTRLSPPCSYAGPDIEAHCEDGESVHFLPSGTGVTYTRVTGTVKAGTLVLQKDIAARDVDGSDLRTVIPGRDGSDCFEAQAAPRGSSMLYVCKQTETRLAVFVSAADGSEAKQITPWSLSGGDDPDWSPDGKLILFKSFVDGPKQSQLYVVKPDGTGLQKLTHFKPNTIVSSASFSPDGKWIVFGSTGVAGQADIFIMRSNGTGMRQVTRTKLWESAPDWGRAS